MVGVGKLIAPAPIQCSTPITLFLKAAPKCISRRTSYHRTRLAFHSYPQVIRDFFNRHRFGPPSRFTMTSTCPWIDRTASGPSHKTLALFRLGFPSAAWLFRHLTSLYTMTRRLILQKAYRHSRIYLNMPSLRSLVGTRIQVSFTPLPGCFSPFPLGTASLSVVCSV